MPTNTIAEYASQLRDMFGEFPTSLPGMPDIGTLLHPPTVAQAQSKILNFIFIGLGVGFILIGGWSLARD